MPANGSAPSRINRKPGAVAVVGIAGLGLLKRRDRRIVLAEFFADVAEREPGGGEIRRQLDRLQQQIGGGGQIALQLQIAGKFEPAVGHQIAGGEKQARRHGHIARHRIIEDSEDDARVKPAHDG